MSLKILPPMRKATWTMIENRCLSTFLRPHRPSSNKGNGTEKREKSILVTWIQTIHSIKFREFSKAFESGLMTPNLYADWTFIRLTMKSKKIADWSEHELKTKYHLVCSPTISLGTLMAPLPIKGIWGSSCSFQRWISVWNSVLKREPTNSIAESSKANPLREFHVLWENLEKTQGSLSWVFGWVKIDSIYFFIIGFYFMNTLSQNWIKLSI